MAKSNISFTITINAETEAIAHMSLKAKFKLFDTLIQETFGCGHYLICSGGHWSIKITKSDWHYCGTLNQVLTAVICEITANRKRNENPRNKKAYRY